RGGSSAALLIDDTAGTLNTFENCAVITDGAAGHGIHINHASTQQNVFNRCTVSGRGTTGTGIYVQAGTDNMFYDCGVEDCATEYDIVAGNYIVGCHEESQITTNNTIEKDHSQIYVDTQSEVASHVVALSTSDSELQSKLVSHALGVTVGLSEHQSKLVSHVLEQSQVLSQVESST
ncbi:unnamed protein product, partial [marine sediment metagenome]